MDPSFVYLALHIQPLLMNVFQFTVATKNVGAFVPGIFSDPTNGMWGLGCLLRLLISSLTQCIPKMACYKAQHVFISRHRKGCALCTVTICEQSVAVIQPPVVETGNCNKRQYGQDLS